MGAPASFSALLAALQHQGAVAATVLPGHGQPARTVPADFWAAVDELADELSEPAFVVGYSLGGRLALGLACRHPRRVRGVIAIGANPGLLTPQERVARVAWEDELAHHLEAAGLPAFLDAWEKLPLFASQAELPPEVRAAQRRIREAHDCRALAQVLRVLGTGHMPTLELPRAVVPILLVTGEHDTKLESASRALVQLTPRIAHRSIPGAGHNPVLETPDLIARIIDDQLLAWSETRTLENHA
jgi:2-succinyl-6-hydroxy-2,4-cyclohexadiene-1-carboxylate synthase